MLNRVAKYVRKLVKEKEKDPTHFTKVVNNVPFKRNRTTILSGNLFTAETKVSSITINSDAYESDL